MSVKELRSFALRQYAVRFLVLSCLTYENLFESVKVPDIWKLQAEVSDTLLTMKRQKSQHLGIEKFLLFKCKHCNAEFDSSRAYILLTGYIHLPLKRLAVKKKTDQKSRSSVVIKRLEICGSAHLGAQNWVRSSFHNSNTSNTSNIQVSNTSNNAHNSQIIIK